MQASGLDRTQPVGIPVAACTVGGSMINFPGQSRTVALRAEVPGYALMTEKSEDDCNHIRLHCNHIIQFYRVSATMKFGIETSMSLWHYHVHMIH